MLFEKRILFEKHMHRPIDRTLNRFDEKQKSRRAAVGRKGEYRAKKQPSQAAFKIPLKSGF
jgi:hypothetical protein